MASAMIRVKAIRAGDARRFSIRRASPGLPVVRSALAETYAIAPSSFELRYKDDDGDMINVKTEGDWAEAVDAVGPGGTVRLDLLGGSEPSPSAWEVVSESELAELATSAPASRGATGGVAAPTLTSTEQPGGVDDNSTPASPRATITPPFGEQTTGNPHNPHDWNVQAAGGTGSDRSISVSSAAEPPEVEPKLEPAEEATESHPSSGHGATDEQKIAEAFHQVMDGIHAAAGIVVDESSELGEMVREAFDGVVKDITDRVDLEQHDAAAAGGDESTNAAAEATASAESTEPVLHPNVICDGCNSAIVGTRFKSLTHPDFDLCATCEAAGMHPEHIMIRIRTPSQKASRLAHKLQQVVARCYPQSSRPDRQGCAMQAPFWAAFVPPGAFPHHAPPHGRGRHGHHGPKHHHRGGGRRHGSGRHHHPGDRKFAPADDQLPTGRLERGSHGPGVAQLQHFLIKAGLMDPSAIRWRDGLFGPRTAAAVQAFQEANQLEGEHGVFDAVVRAALLAGWPTKTAAASATRPPDTSSPAPAAAPTAPVEERTGADFVRSSMAPSAPSTAEQPTKWSEQLETLRTMGFSDVDRNNELLDKHNGAVPFVVTELLQ